MSKIVFQIGRKSPRHRSIPGWSYLFGDSLKTVLGDSYVLSLEVDGHTIDHRRKTSWGQDLSPNSLLSFLDSYRNQPGATRPDESIREGLHHFLFAQRLFDGPFAGALAQDAAANERSEILILGDSSSLPLIINIPWELAEAVHTFSAPANREPTLANTLAAFQLARVIGNTQAQATLVNERLRVLYCISQPPTLGSIQASDFHVAIRDALEARSGMLTYQAVIDGDFTPSFDALKTEIELTKPHVLIVACHGQTLDGVPQLRFEEWHPVSSLAAALAQTGKAFLVLLIACDQTHLDEHPAAHSGAVALLKNGILSVVAMQSSVSALLAKEFLGTTLDWFFKSGSISLSAAEGRKSMAPSATAVANSVDWSFPALFLTQDAPQHTHKLARIIQAYFPTLDEMLRRIPRPEIYLQRPEFDQPLGEMMRVGAAGLAEVSGAAYTGKTTVVLNACRNALKNAIELNDTSSRPVLYVDFERYGEPPRNARELMEILRKQTEEIQSTAAGTPLLSWASPREADGEPGTNDSIGQLAALIDLNRMVLILDNLQETNEPFWSEFFLRLRSLSRSLVIRVTETASANVVGDLKVLPLNRAQTEEYVRLFAPEHMAATDHWYDLTNGLPGLLDLLRKSEGDDEVVSVSAGLFTRNLPAAEQNILYTLANLPNGVDPQLAGKFADADLRDLLRLAQEGLLLRESRFGVTISWFRLPGLLMRALHDDADRTNDAAILFANRFLDGIDAGAESVEAGLINLATLPGGIDFLQDVHQILLNVGYDDASRAVPYLLHDALFERGRWYDAFRLWDRLLTKTEFHQSSASEWLRLAKAAHILGFGPRAADSIDKAKECGLTRLDEIDLPILQAIIIKDSGGVSRAAEVTALYEEILQLIAATKRDLSTPELEDVTESDLDRRAALTIYNRALHRRYWLRDLDGALSDLDQAAANFGQLGLLRMKALADCEWVDIQLDWPKQDKNWDEMLQRLVKAQAAFSSAGGAAGDSAFCYYQLARYFRRKPFATPDESKKNSTRAREAYRAASRQAQLAGDSRQKEIAEGHLAEISWLDLGEIGAAEAAEKLGNVVSVLQTYKGDAWAARVVRDMSLRRAQALRQSNPGNSLDVYKAAWDAANQSPLHPAFGVDARRGARILAEYVQELESNKRSFEAGNVSALAKECIEQWLGHSIDPLNTDSWIDEVRRFSIGPGEYHGKSKR